jgi:hypothetical protein
MAGAELEGSKGEWKGMGAEVGGFRGEERPMGMEVGAFKGEERRMGMEVEGFRGGERRMGMGRPLGRRVVRGGGRRGGLRVAVGVGITLPVAPVGSTWIAREALLSLLHRKYNFITS